MSHDALATMTSSASRGERMIAWGQIVAQAVRPCRLSLFVAALGIGVLLGVAQSGDALAGLCDDDRIGLLAFGTWVWGWTGYYTARIMLRFFYPDASNIPHGTRLYDWIARWLPRALGLAPLVGVSCELCACPAREHRTKAVSILLTVTVAFAIFLVKRRALLRALERSFGERWKSPLAQSLWRDLDHLYDADLRNLGELPRITQVVLSFQLLCAGLFFLGCLLSPVRFACALGAPTVLVFAFASWIASGTVITYLSSWTQIPLSLLLLVYASVLSGFFDNHAVSKRPDAETVCQRSGIVKDFDTWQERNDSKNKPFIVVAAEGGGIRAAYFTAAILSGLQDHPGTDFKSRLYAISSVSGGSLGAAAFDALLARGKSNLRSQAKVAMGQDFLAPPLARLVSTDLFARFLPWNAKQLDRAKALEAAWTASLDDGTSPNEFATPFDEFWRIHPHLPRLFLNSTWVEKGSRALLSYPRPHALEKSDCECAQRAPDPSEDPLDADPLASLTLVQATHASARFPYISPPLAVSTPEGTWGHFVDGGYFENSGAVTAKQILDTITLARSETKANARAIIIHFCDGEPDPARWATELTVPPIAFFAARDARGALALAELKAAYPFVEFCMIQKPKAPKLPLGWMLSAAAAAELDDEARDALADGSVAQVVYDWLQ